MVVKQNWLGKPLGTNKSYNFFKSNSKTLPVNMFKDSDRDGVMNVFDCKPNNPNEQGLVSALIGAVGGLFKGEKGAVKKGWREGMAQPGYFERREFRKSGGIMPERVRKAQANLYLDEQKRLEPSAKTVLA